MNNVVYLNKTCAQKKVGTINGVVVEHPETCYEYLLLCKRFLMEEDYKELLISIMDIEYYNSAEKQIKYIVDRYREFRV